MEIDAEGLRGLWQREIITYSDGHTDSSLMIYWMQSNNLYADIRVPYDFAPFRSGACLDDLSQAEMAQLARLGGFAGHIVLDGAQCRWIREIDWQPFTGVEDAATLGFDGPDIVEDGGACGGHQIWRRLTPHGVHATGFKLHDPTDGRKGVLVSLADQFIYVRGRLSPIAPASGLAELLNGCEGDGEAARALLDSEVSYGKVDANGSWKIALSTQPWRIGDVLIAPEVKLSTDRLAISERDQAGRSVQRIWDIIAHETTTRSPDGLKPTIPL